jgi:anhydro-N-acetylmuramic acid kinase
VAELTVISLCNSIEKLDALTEKVYFCGGGVHNEYLMSRISTELDKNCPTTHELGIDPDYLEAICFAWLAFKRVSGIKFDMSQITGSKKKVYLGKVYVPVI